MTTTPPTQVPSLRFRQAFETMKPELALVQPSELLVINLEIPASVIIVLGCHPQLQNHRADIVRQLPEFDIALFDKIETYALGTGYAHTHFLAASAPVEPVQELADEVGKAREMLVSDVTALAKRKLLDGERLTKLQGAVGFKNLAFDVLFLATLMREHWSEISGKTAVQMDELDRAEQLADRLATAVGLRDQGPNVASAASDERQRAYTLFVNAYDQVRRALTYLRWDKEDVDIIAPSLYAGRGGGRKKAEAPPVAEPVLAPGDVVPVRSATGASGGSDSATHPGKAPGMPDNDPFGRG